LNSGFFIFSTVFLALATGYLAATTPRRYVLYLIVMLLAGASVLGMIFKILHSPRADEFLLLGFAGQVAGAALLIRSGIKNDTGKIRLHQLLLGIVIVAQMAAANLFLQELSFARIANYLIVALAATPLVRNEYQHEAEWNLLVLVLIYSIIPVIGDFIGLF
jgi:hypothetical protein